MHVSIAIQIFAFQCLSIKNYFGPMGRRIHTYTKPGRLRPGTGHLFYFQGTRGHNEALILWTESATSRSVSVNQENLDIIVLLVF